MRTCVSVLGIAAVLALAAPPLPSSGVVQVAWSASTAPLLAEPSIQVVTQHFLLKNTSTPAVYSNSWAAVNELQVRNARFAAWFPYARAGVAELDPPSGQVLCGPTMWAKGQMQPFTLDCSAAGGIASIDFASFGTPTGVCGNYATNRACNDPNSLQIVTSACLGKSSCTLDPTMFSAKCAASYLAVAVRCGDSSKQHTYWDFTYVDSLFMDFWNAVNADAGSEPIVSFSTAPTWMYSATDFSFEDDPTAPWYGYNRGTAPAINGSALGDYYGRLASWYALGGFDDEYGTWHDSGHSLNLTAAVFEVFNEVDYEHAHTPQSYTQDFDSVVQGVRRWLGPSMGPSIRFNGMNLPNIDDQTQVVQWAQYFLNRSNHNPAVQDDQAFAFIGYHAYPTQGSYTPDPTTLAGVFEYVDSIFIPKVLAVDQVIAQLSPSTRTLLDECGTDMDGVLTPGLAPPANNPAYWVASGSYFVYLYTRISAIPGTSVRVVGHSQIMDAPGQEPSVTLLDWSSGNGTAAYWATWMMIRAVTPAVDTFVNTTVVPGGNDAGGLYAQAFWHTPSPQRPSLPGASATGPIRRIVLVNRLNSNATATISPTALGPKAACQAWIVDTTTELGPPRQVNCAASSSPPMLVLLPYASAIVELA